MLNKNELIKLLLFFIRVNDTQVVSDSELITKDVCLQDELSILNEIMIHLIDIRERFDYSKSPEFENQIIGKSNEFIEMKKKINNKPIKKIENLKRLDSALESLIYSKEAYDLIEYNSHKKLKRIVEQIQSLSNPI